MMFGSAPAALRLQWINLQSAYATEFSAAAAFPRLMGCVRHNADSFDHTTSMIKAFFVRVSLRLPISL
jgi:hypothetical protein